MVLKEILKSKQEELKELKKKVPLAEIKQKAESMKNEEAGRFLNALKTGFSIIAEIKRCSPSHKELISDADIEKTAKQYEEGGARIISILTEKEFFKGDIKHLERVKSTVSIPVLRKDFIIDEYQIYESKIHGANGILLIVDALKVEDIKKFLNITHELGMEAIVEIHNQEELDKITPIMKHINIIGINNRNLNTLQIDLNTTEKLINKIPTDKIIISESGIHTKENFQRIRNSGPNGVLIGTSLMISKDKKAKLREFLS